MEICKIILPIVTPSLNELLRMHWTKQRRLRKDYGWELVAVGMNDPIYKVNGQEKRGVRFMSFRPGMLDQGNLIGGFKPLEDALIDLGLIFDDSPKFADISYFQKVDRENPRTEILIMKGGAECHVKP